MQSAWGKVRQPICGRSPGACSLLLKHQCWAERAALPADLQLGRTGPRDLFKEPVGEQGLFLKKNNPFCGFITLWAWMAAREKGALPSSEGCCEPWCFLPVLTGFLCSSSSGMPFPQSPINPPFPGCCLLAAPGSCRAEGTAVSAASPAGAPCQAAAGFAAAAACAAGGSFRTREKCSFWRGSMLCSAFVQTQVKGCTTTSWQIIYFRPFALRSPFQPMRLPWVQVK